MEEPTRILRERCDVTIHENEFGIPRDELLQVIAGRAAIITMLTEQVDAEFLERAGPQLTIVANYAVGFDNIDVAACTAAGVLATNTPDVLTETTADTAFALLMAAARRVGEGERFLRAHTPWIWGPLMMLGQDVHHKTIGIVGFGRIGQAVARRAKGFGMRVIYSDSVQLPADVEAETGAERRELDDLLAEADFVSIHTNLTPETRHLFDAETFTRMKRTAVLVNTSRGPVVDELALADALAVRRDLRRRPRRVRTRAGGRGAAALARERRGDPPPGERHRRHPRRDGARRRAERVRRARRRASADPAQPGRSEGLIPVADREAGRAGRREGPRSLELRRNVRLLTTMLGDAIAESGGAELLEQVETLRKAAIAFRGRPTDARRRRVTDLVAALDLARAEDVIRAFTCYFQLVNLAEERQRVRTLRAGAGRAGPSRIRSAPSRWIRRPSAISGSRRC